VSSGNGSLDDIAYLCQEDQICGCPWDKKDVYAFGVVLAELLTGKRPVIDHGNVTERLSAFIRRKLLPSCNSLLENSQLDASVQKTWPTENFQRFAKLMRQCIDISPGSRPAMTEISFELGVLVKEGAQ